MTEENIITESIDIPVYKKEYLQKKIDIINRKAVKMGCMPMILTFDNPHVIDYSYHPVTGAKLVNPLKVEMVTATLNYIIPLIEGYELIAKLDIYPSDTGDVVLVSAVPDKHVPDKYKNATSIECDHCGWKRNRNHSVVLRNTAPATYDEYIQVGSTCVKDFFGLDPKGFLFMASIKFDDLVGGIDEERAWGGNGFYGYELMDVLAFSAASIVKWGWVSKGTAYKYDGMIATASHVWDNLEPSPKMPEADKVAVEAEDIELAKKALDYFEAKNPENNDYLLNICKIIKMGYVPSKYMGYACSIVSSYNREVEKKAKVEATIKENDECPSKFQGEMKERLKGIRVVVTYSREFENDFGTNTLYAFKDALGNVYKSFYSGTTWSAKVGDVLIIDGTVKKHNTFNRVEETMLNRVAVKPAPEEAFTVKEFTVA